MAARSWSTTASPRWWQWTCCPAPAASCPTTPSPGGANPFRGPAGIAVDAANGRALVADKSQGALLAVDLQTGARTVLSDRFTPDDVNPLFAPLGVAVDPTRTAGPSSSPTASPGCWRWTSWPVPGPSCRPTSPRMPSIRSAGPLGIALDSRRGRALVVDNVRDSVLSVNLQTGERTVLSNARRLTPSVRSPRRLASPSTAPMAGPSWWTTGWPRHSP